MGFPFQYAVTSESQPGVFPAGLRHIDASITPSTPHSCVVALFSDNGMGAPVPASGWPLYSGHSAGGFFYRDYVGAAAINFDASVNAASNSSFYSDTSIALVLATNATLGDIGIIATWTSGASVPHLTASPQTSGIALPNHTTIIVALRSTVQSGGEASLTAVTDSAGNQYYGPINKSRITGEVYYGYSVSCFVAIDIPANPALIIYASTDQLAAASYSVLEARAFTGPYKLGSGFAFGGMML